MPSPQTRLQDLLDRLVRQGRERGLQLAVYHEGHLVVNAFAGVADPVTGRAVDAETLFSVFSVSKGITATIIHRLAERGRLTYDQPIAELWPEFAARGKGAITIRHALNHSAGLPYMPSSIGVADLCDWSTMCAAIADLSPAWPPGTIAEYHPMTYGWILGEVAQRATGKSFSQLLEEEIRQPLGEQALYMGIPDSAEARMATLEEAPPSPAPPTDPFRELVPRWTLPLAASANRPEIRRACLPGFGAVLTARALARHYAALLPGGVDGIELLPPDRVRKAIAPQGIKTAEGESFRWLLGYHASDEPFDLSHPPTAFGHDGHGGALGMVDLRRRLALGFARNLLNDPETRMEIVTVLREIFPPYAE